MRHRSTFAFLAVASLLLPTAAAGLMPVPATDVAERQDALFRVINGIALVIGIVVEALLLYFLVRFHRNKDIPRDEAHRGNTKAEIAWTFAPVVVLVFIAYQSVVVMGYTDASPEDFVASAAESRGCLRDDKPCDPVHVLVVGHQFLWEFRYANADGTMPEWTDIAAPWPASAFNELRVEEGRPVVLHVTSRDVGHAFRVPEFGIMVDAWPNRENIVHFTAPAFKPGGPRDNGDYIQYQEQKDDGMGAKDLDPNVYFVQCQEYCGTGHSGMRAKVVVFAEGSQPLPYGSAELGKSVCDEPVGDRTLVPVVMKESGGDPWSIALDQTTFAPGAKVRFDVTIEGGAPHNFDLGPPVGKKTPDFTAPGRHCLDVDMPATPQKLTYRCSVPGHDQLGMIGELSVA